MHKYLSNQFFLVSLAAIGCALGLQVGSAIPLLRVILAFILLIYLPGYALSAALFVNQPFKPVERNLIRLGSSILLAIIAGVILNLTGLGLNASSWSAGLCGFTLIGCLIAGLRRSKAGTGSILPRKPNLRSDRKWGIIGLVRGGGLILFLSVLLTIGAIGLAQTPISNPANLQGYTLLWILPAGSDSTGAVNLGVMNGQFTTTGYDLRIMVDNQVVNEWPAINLAPGQKWEIGAELPGNRTGSTLIEAVLYKLDNPNTVYRQVNLLVGP